MIEDLAINALECSLPDKYFQPFPYVFITNNTSLYKIVDKVGFPRPGPYMTVNIFLQISPGLLKLK